MRIAIIDDDMMSIEVLRDVLGKYKPDFFSDPYKFNQIDYSDYDLILIDHSIGAFDWKDLYCAYRSHTKADFGIMATYSQEYYRLEMPSKCLLTEEVIKDPRITGILKKHDHDALVGWVELSKLKKESMDFFKNYTQNAF